MTNNPPGDAQTKWPPLWVDTMLDLLHIRAQLDVRMGVLSLSASATSSRRVRDDDVELEEAWAGQCTRDGEAMSAAGVGAPRVLRHAPVDDTS